MLPGVDADSHGGREFLSTAVLLDLWLALLPWSWSLGEEGYIIDVSLWLNAS